MTALTKKLLTLNAVFSRISTITFLRPKTVGLRTLKNRFHQDAPRKKHEALNSNVTNSKHGSAMWRFVLSIRACLEFRTSFLGRVGLRYETTKKYDNNVIYDKRFKPAHPFLVCHKGAQYSRKAPLNKEKQVKL